MHDGKQKGAARGRACGVLDAGSDNEVYPDDAGLEPLPSLDIEFDPVLLPLTPVTETRIPVGGF